MHHCWTICKEALEWAAHTREEYFCEMYVLCHLIEFIIKKNKNKRKNAQEIFYIRSIIYFVCDQKKWHVYHSITEIVRYWRIVHFLVSVPQHPSLPPAVFLHWHWQLASHLQPLPHFVDVHWQSNFVMRIGIKYRENHKCNKNNSLFPQPTQGIFQITLFFLFDSNR